MTKGQGSGLKKPKEFTTEKRVCQQQLGKQSRSNPGCEGGIDSGEGDEKGSEGGRREEEREPERQETLRVANIVLFSRSHGIRE